MDHAPDAPNFLFPKSSPHVHDPKKSSHREFGEPAEKTGGGPGVVLSDSHPYYERIEVVDSMREEIQDIREQLRAAKKRQRALEQMNSDIEHLLEKEARHRMEVESNFAKYKTEAERSEKQLQTEVASWKQRCQTLVRRDDYHKTKIHRLEKDLYSMLKRKYDMEKAWKVREAESSQDATTKEREEVLERLQRDNEEFRKREEAIAAAVIQRRSGLSTRIKQESLLSNVKNFFGMR